MWFQLANVRLTLAAPDRAESILRFEQAVRSALRQALSWPRLRSRGSHQPYLNSNGSTSFSCCLKTGITCAPRYSLYTWGTRFAASLAANAFEPL